MIFNSPTNSKLLAFTTKTANYSLTINDDVIAADPVSVASFTLSLPAATGSGKVFEIFFSALTYNGNTVTVARNGSDTITELSSGLTSVLLHTPGERIVIQDVAAATWKVKVRDIPAFSMSVTPTGAWSTNTTYSGRITRLRNWIRYSASIALAGAPTSATLTVNVPLSLVIDTSELAAGTLAQILPSGEGLASDTGTSTTQLHVKYTSTTAVLLVYDNSNSPTVHASVTQAAPYAFGNTDFINFSVDLPIVGWNK